MQIGNPLPANNLRLFRGRTESFKCSGSPLKPSPTKSPAVKLGSSAELTRKHLSSLEKLLDKETESSPAPEPRNDRRKGSPVNKGKLVLEELKLARIWPEMKAAEEMSPRHLNMLQRLLAMTPEYSPRNNLGSRWREYHGENDWSGLLDPLDENLRREIVRYGEFIQAAYHCFHTNPYTAAEEFPLPPHVSLPDKSYKVTKSLYATSSIGLPKWMDEVAPNLNWMTQRSSWIGYVAVCDDKQEIQRMGRRDIVIALRGTATCLEWAENMRDLLVQIPRQNDLVAHRQPKVECGFFSLYKTKSPHVSSLSQLVTEEVLRLQKLYKGETLSITVTGHSLGAALALLIADELTFSVPDVPPTAIFSFGGPRVGNRAFTNHINTKKIKVLRIVNSQDLITRVPGIFVNEKLDSKLRTIGQTTTKLLDVFDDFMPWAYSHVGIELRVDTKMSPFLKPDADMACCHDLEAYLHLVDGFLASNCPFRANAKRSPLRLLHEQKTNIKMLYTKKASALSLNQEREGNDILLSRQVITRYIKLPTSWR